jgi:ATP-dependent DNA helicase RecQ
MSVAEKLLERCVLLDLEVRPDGKIIKLGAVFRGQEYALKGRFKASDIPKVLNPLARKADFVLGHNLLNHDLPILKQQFPRLRLNKLPVIDTLFLSPLAFPENPYHHLVKDYRLMSTGLNDPVLDARNAGILFADQVEVFETLKETHRALLPFYGWAFSGTMRAFFQALEIKPFTVDEAQAEFAKIAAGCGCRTAANALGLSLRRLNHLESAAYTLAWLRVAGSNSILPPWVRYQFPEVVEFVRSLRERGCSDPDCSYCTVNHNPQAQLKRFFGFEDFRSEPASPDGGSLQEAIVRCGMNDEPLLAILPTGGGKSLCYQLPALVRNQRRGVLSIVISPLQALMKDQVENLNRQTESSFAAALYGMLTMPERGAVLERVRLGDVAILYVSPEQLRNVSFRNIVKQREIGCWIFDEAHCLSRWGHSFRPDYLYASRFIRELAEQQKTKTPPVACFTATAKQDVVAEIQQHFETELAQNLTLFDGGAERTNLGFEVQMVNAAEKETVILNLLQSRLPTADSGSSVIYCATREGTRRMAEWLQQKGLSVEAFHAGLEVPEKRRIQDAFIGGSIQHICATNAFGMGIDKDNVRLVIHADIPGSLENYLQEAGRAGRDREHAYCVLLYDEQDIETQFSMSAFSRLTRHDIAQILRGLRRAKKDAENKVVITAGEILRDDEVDTGFDTDDKMYATKVNTAVSMLERGDFVQRDENRTRVIQARPLLPSMNEAVEKISTLDLSARTKQQWEDMLRRLYDHDPNEAFSADELAELPSMVVQEEPVAYRTLRHDTLTVLKILNDMVNAGLIKKDTLLSAFVKVRCANASEAELAELCRLEQAMLAILREEEPDAEGVLSLSLRRLNQRLLDDGYTCAPESLRMLLKSLELDGQGLAGSRGSLELKYRDKDRYSVTLHRNWEALTKTAEKRQAVAGVLLRTIIAKISQETKGEHLVEFSESDLIEGLRSDMLIAAQITDFGAAIERGLLFLHEQKVIILQQGLAIFRSAMTITILPTAKGRGFTMGDYSSLKEHYGERVFQIHVMNRYAGLGLGDIRKASELVRAYFTMAKSLFVKRFFPGEKEMLERATSAESYQTIVEGLNNAIQTSVVSAKPSANLLVLAGPGSGKTRVIAHRCAYLLRVERVRPREILVVCFNRAAAISLRQRIRALVGKDAFGVTVQTYHSLAMRLIGASLAEHSERSQEQPDFDEMIRSATRMLKGECELPGLERDEMRERLLAGYRHILIDEYQDINQDQYELISAIAGRTIESKNEDAKLSILAVGDDDQNIYSFQGANIGFIRQFENDYEAKIHYLVENYRSSGNIIDASNRLIACNRDRMKRDHPIRINHARKSDSLGAPVQIVRCSGELDQARSVLQAVQGSREAGGSIAVFARTNLELCPVRAALETAQIPNAAVSGRKDSAPVSRMREPQALISFLKDLDQFTVTAQRIQQEFRRMDCYSSDNPWCTIVDAILSEWESTTLNHARPPADAVDFLYEALYDLRHAPPSADAVHLSTVHAAKGLEFDHVILLGNWHAGSNDEEERRLYYVGMTRAKQTLTLYKISNVEHPYTNALQGSFIRELDADVPPVPADDELRLRYTLLSLSDVWIGYGASSRNIQRDIDALKYGDLVCMEQRPDESRIFIRDKNGQKIGALSNAASERWGHRLSQIKRVSVYAVVKWRKGFSGTSADETCPEEWEVPLLEIVWVGSNGTSDPVHV